MDIELYDLIDVGAAKRLTAQLKAAKGAEVDLRINSAGGVAFEGVAMFNALRSHKGAVHVHVDGLAASAATIPMMAGESISMASNAQVMIHKSRVFSMGALTARDARRIHSQLGRTDKQAANIYSERTGMDLEDIQVMMDEETWMDADEALSKGFISEISEPSTVALNCSQEQSREWFTRPEQFEAICQARVTPVDDNELKARIESILCRN